MTKRFNKEHGVVYVACHETAQHLDFKITREDIIDGIIDFKIGMSLLSFGEKFRITITEIENKVTEVTVGSQAAVAIQIIDWGKNKGNINDFFELLSERLSK